MGCLSVHINIVLNLKVEVDPSRVPSSHYYKVLHFFVGELRSHCSKGKKDMIRKVKVKKGSSSYCRRPADSPGGGMAMM